MDSWYWQRLMVWTYSYGINNTHGIDLNSFRLIDKLTSTIIQLKEVTRLWHGEVARQNKTEVREFLEPQQLGQSVAGAAKLVFSTGGLLDLREENCCFQLDLENFHNTLGRRTTLDVISRLPSLSHLQTFAAAILSPVSDLESRGEVWGVMGDGNAQGDPISGDFAAIGLQPALEQLDRDCQAGGGMARAGADDVAAQGQYNVVLGAVRKFETTLTTCGVRINWGKSRLYLREGDLPADAPPGLALAGEQVGATFLRGMMLFGVPVAGSDEYKAHKLREVKDKIILNAKRTIEVLAPEGQGL